MNVVKIYSSLSYYLDDLLVVGFGCLDASALLNRVEQFSRDVQTMREMLQEKATLTRLHCADMKINYIMITYDHMPITVLCNLCSKINMLCVTPQQTVLMKETGLA